MTRQDSCETEPGASGGLVLFDGVCNLCNAAVGWIIARDRRGRFRFASLQSDAAGRELCAHGVSGDLPDSIVLIDDDGVHTQSEAVLRIASGLGLPWSLAGVARVLPGALRDAAYSCVAHHRYRWFGRRQACMLPSEALMARFLDADEPPRVIEADDRSSGAGSGAPAWVSGLGRLGLRTLCCYFLIYLFSFPLNRVPWIRWFASFYEGNWGRLVPWFAGRVFGVPAPRGGMGSGDRVFDYVQLLLIFVFAVLAGIAWHAIARGRPISGRVLDAFRVYCRYCLAFVMIMYGWAKVFPVQMPHPGPDRLIQSFGDASPLGLLWTSIGSSPGYEMLSGSAEVVGGMLLFWRRTTLLGAIILAGVLVNVVALNFFYDVPVKLFSSHLLMVSLILIAPDAVRLASVVVLNLPAQPRVLRPYTSRRKWVLLGALGVKLSLIGYFGVYPAVQWYRMLTPLGMVGPKHALHGVYIVESFTRDGVADRDNEDADRWVRLGISWRGIRSTIGVQRATGVTARYALTIRDEDSEIDIRVFETTDTQALEFTLLDDERVRITGEFDGATIDATMRRSDESSSLLISRGFRWVNETTFNR